MTIHHGPPWRRQQLVLAFGSGLQCYRWARGLEALVRALADIRCPPPNASFKDWSHITSQIGMFAFTGLSPKQVELITKKHHIYCTKNGRFSVAGINPNNVKSIAAAIKDAVTSNSKL